MLLSILVLVYNHEKYLIEALDSINDQSFKFETEMLIGNDCSTDKSASILNQYVFSNKLKVNIVNREKNVSATNNLFDLIMRSSGKYIAILEGDDFWNSRNKINEQLDFLELNKKYSACYTDINLVDINSNILSDDCFRVGFDGNEYKLFNFEKLELPGQTGTLVMKNPKYYLKKQIIKNIITFDNLIGDRGLCYLSLVMGNVYKINTKMSSYRIQNFGNNFTSKSINENNNYRLLNIYKNMRNESKKIFNRELEKCCSICMSKLCINALLFCIKDINKKNLEIFFKCLFNSNNIITIKILVNRIFRKN